MQRRTPFGTTSWSVLLALFALTLLGCSTGGDGASEAVSKGPLMASLYAFSWGFGTSLTPCVYPMIAITVSVFGAKQAESRRQAALLSTAFVLGISVLFTLLFVAAALSGGMFGAILQNKWVLVGIAAIFIALAASMFGAFELTLPESVMQRLSSVGGVGVGGAFTLGLVTGPIAAPCSGPGLIALLTEVTRAQDWKLGALFGMSYSFGLGILFWVVGTFAAGLPKGGRWMVWVKSLFGIALVVLALRYINTAFPQLGSFAKNELNFKLIAIGVLLGGFAIGALHLDFSDGLGAKIRKGLGIATSVTGGFMFIAAIDLPPPAPIISAEELKDESGAEIKPLEWGKDEAQGVALAKSEKRPMILDFGAAWCQACKELEHKTFADKEVIKKGGRFVAVKIDLTDDEDPANAALKKKYNIQGLPAVLLLDSEGKEVKRITEFVEAPVFLAALEQVK